MRHLLTLSDVTASEIETILAVSDDLKDKYQQGVREPLLPGRVMAMLFEKPSLRTRVSFESAMAQLGGSSLFLGSEVGWRTRESAADFGQVISEYIDLVVVRAFDHQSVVDLAENCSRPVINGLTNLAHPCQALADLMTLKELLGRVAGHKLAYVGDANNVARSLARCCQKVGMELAVASPPGYQFEPEFVAEVQSLGTAPLSVTDDPREAVAGAAAVYTDVWASMGQESEAAARRKVFAPYQVNAELMALAPGAYFLHCLPAHRGEEVTEDVMDSPNCAAIKQAGNRMHVTKGILAWLMGQE